MLMTHYFQKLNFFETAGINTKKGDLNYTSKGDIPVNGPQIKHRSRTAVPNKTGDESRHDREDL